MLHENSDRKFGVTVLISFRKDVMMSMSKFIFIHGSVFVYFVVSFYLVSVGCYGFLYICFCLKTIYALTSGFENFLKSGLKNIVKNETLSSLPKNRKFFL